MTPLALSSEEHFVSLPYEMDYVTFFSGRKLTETLLPSRVCEADEGVQERKEQDWPVEMWRCQKRQTNDWNRMGNHLAD